MDANSQTLQVPPWLSFTMASKVCTQATDCDAEALSLEKVCLRSRCLEFHKRLHRASFKGPGMGGRGLNCFLDQRDNMLLLEKLKQ